jgi:hypothetical protein
MCPMPLHNARRGNWLQMGLQLDCMALECKPPGLNAYYLPEFTECIMIYSTISSSWQTSLRLFSALLVWDQWIYFILWLWTLSSAFEPNFLLWKLKCFDLSWKKWRANLKRPFLWLKPYNLGCYHSENTHFIRCHLVPNFCGSAITPGSYSVSSQFELRPEAGCPEWGRN